MPLKELPQDLTPAEAMAQAIYEQGIARGYLHRQEARALTLLFADVLRSIPETHRRVEALYEVVDDHVQLRVIQQADGGRPFACGPKCNACCCMTVGATVPEVLLVAAYLLRTKGRGARRRLAVRLEAVGAMGKERQWKEQVPCPLLKEDGLCGVYEVRPAQCRSMHSMDARSCVEATTRPVRADLMDIADALQDALAVSLMGQGLRPRYNAVNFAGALAIALRTENAEALWLAGSNLFEPAAIPISARPGKRDVPDSPDYAEAQARYEREHKGR